MERAKELTKSALPHVTDKTIDYYVSLDEPDRTSYKRFDWRSEYPDESIWLVGEGRDPTPIDDNAQSKIVAALKDTKYFHRLILPKEVETKLHKDMKSDLEKLQKGKG